MYQPVVGLEIHVQVKTKSKMFCRCNAQYFESEANTNTCPVCFGLPGAIPVPNKTAIEKVIKLALALNCSINQETKFDRKNYFYPDLAKGYQISQYDQPIGYEGYVEIEVEGDSRRIRVQRVHIEEDTAKSLHSENDTLIDYNKSGVPLVEIVTYPDFASVAEVVLFAKRLKQIVRYLEVSDAEMQKGQMRFELNISVKPDTMPANVLPNYKVEVKNIGSISVLEKVLGFELKRQSGLLEKGEQIKSQTRGLKDMTGETLFQRSKETADDYRYFPEPDIPPIHITSDQLSAIRLQLPELPHQRKERYMSLGLESEQADIFVEDIERGNWFDKLIDASGIKNQESGGVAKDAAKWIVGEISGQLEKRGQTISEMKLKTEDLLSIIKLIKSNQISGGIAKEVIAEILENGGSAEQIIKDKNLIQVSDSGEVEKLAQQVINENPKLVEDLVKNPNVVKALVGQMMRLSKGKVNPKVAEEELKKILKI